MEKSKSLGYCGPSVGGLGFSRFFPVASSILSRISFFIFSLRFVLLRAMTTSGAIITAAMTMVKSRGVYEIETVYVAVADP